MDEFTVFIKVKIDNLKEFSKLIPLILSIEVNIKSDIIKIIIVKKYLLISLKSKLMLVNINLFIKTFLGLLNDKIWLIEYLNKEYILINLRPELVEKKEPPIITKIKKTKLMFVWSVLSEKPIFDMLLTIAKRFTENSLLKLKNKRKINTIIVRYTIKWRSS